MKFLMHVGKGYGNRWTGIIFRKRAKDLGDLEKKGKRLFQQLSNPPRYISSAKDMKWVWPSGEELMLRHTEKPEQYDGFHGWEVPFIVWDELTTWPNSDLYDSFRSVCRSSIKDMPRFYIGLTNPYGVGHNWVKEHWIDPYPGKPGPTGVGLRDKETGEIRIRFHGDIRENPYLWDNDPDYIKSLMAIKDENKRKAWLHGDWSISFGGFFDGYWDADKHIIKPFKPPVTWPRFLSVDWGFAKPYSIGFNAIDQDGKIYRYNEMYGYGGKADVGTRENAYQVGLAVKRRMDKEIKHGADFIRNIADSAMWSGTGAERTIEEEFSRAKVHLLKAKKGRDSRINGADICRMVLNENMFAVTENCQHWIRTVPVLMPDESNPEDVDTDMEDHAYDDWRYGIVSRHQKAIKKLEEKEIERGTFEHLIRSTSKKQTSSLVYNGS